LLPYYDRLEQEALNLSRTGVYAGWHATYGQPDEPKCTGRPTGSSGKPNTKEMIAKGHRQAWILPAWPAHAAILSDAHTFNAGMKFQGQNIWTEIKTKELCRTVTVSPFWV
jgi:hypothetical protein